MAEKALKEDEGTTNPDSVPYKKTKKMTPTGYQEGEGVVNVGFTNSDDEEHEDETISSERKIGDSENNDNVQNMAVEIQQKNGNTNTQLPEKDLNGNKHSSTNSKAPISKESLKTPLLQSFQSCIAMHQKVIDCINSTILQDLTIKVEPVLAYKDQVKRANSGQAPHVEPPNVTLAEQTRYWRLQRLVEVLQESCALETELLTWEVEVEPTMSEHCQGHFKQSVAEIEKETIKLNHSWDEKQILRILTFEGETDYLENKISQLQVCTENILFAIMECTKAMNKYKMNQEKMEIEMLKENLDKMITAKGTESDVKPTTPKISKWVKPMAAARLLCALPQKYNA